MAELYVCKFSLNKVIIFKKDMEMGLTSGSASPLVKSSWGS